jgi:OPT family oligopeptide transporter
MSNATAEKLQPPSDLPSAPPPEHEHKAPIDKHPDGSPMTQDEIDEYWLKHVFRPNEKQLTVRAVVTGMLLGGALSLSNLYVGLKTGWGLGVTVTAAVLAFGIFSVAKKILGLKDEFTSLENNTMASAASAAGYFTGAGLTSAIPALFLSTGKTFGPIELAIWILSISFLGVFLAVPMRRQMIDVDRLPFPEGLAYAETIRSLHAAPGEARKKSLALLYGAIAGAVMKVLGGFGKIAEEIAVFGHKWAGLGIAIPTDILMVGAGAMMGIRITVGLTLGSIIAFGVLGPWLESHGLAGVEATFGTVRTWVLWPGVAIVVVNGLLSFGLKWRTAFAALKGIGKLAKGASGGMSDVEVPTKWFVRGTLACTAFTVILAKVLFEIPIWMGFLAVVLSILLSIVACRATGETSITPTGALGKITQFMYGGLAAGNIQTNLMTASITAGAAMHSADLLTDLKGGYVLGSRPRYQFVAQFFGLIAGALFCIPAYQLLATPERLGSAQFPAPSAMTWKAVAELLAGGVSQEVRGSSTAMGVHIGNEALSLKLIPRGTVPGDKLQIFGGPSSGEYTVTAVFDKKVMVDRAIPDPRDTEQYKVVIDGRGETSTTGPAAKLNLVQLQNMPESAKKGDYLKARLDGTDVWWSVKARVDDKLVLDHPWTERNGGSLTVEVRKESLPPYAAMAVIIATIVAVVMTLIETYAPKNFRRWLPSISGIGLGFVITGADSIAMLIGALIAWGLEKASPKKAEDYTLTVGSGVMAGASIAGIGVILWSTFGAAILAALHLSK